MQPIEDREVHLGSVFAGNKERINLPEFHLLMEAKANEGKETYIISEGQQFESGPVARV